MRRRFAPMAYSDPAASEVAKHAEAINELLDAGRRVFGDVGRSASAGRWRELAEAFGPAEGGGVVARTSAGLTITVFAYNATPEFAKRFDAMARARTPKARRARGRRRKK